MLYTTTLYYHRAERAPLSVPRCTFCNSWKHVEQRLDSNNQDTPLNTNGSDSPVSGTRGFSTVVGHRTARPEINRSRHNVDHVQGSPSKGTETILDMEGPSHSRSNALDSNSLTRLDRERRARRPSIYTTPLRWYTRHPSHRARWEVAAQYGREVCLHPVPSEKHPTDSAPPSQRSFNLQVSQQTFLCTHLKCANIPDLACCTAASGGYQSARVHTHLPDSAALRAPASRPGVPWRFGKEHAS